MQSTILNRRDIDFLLYEWLAVESLTARERHADHSRETFDAALDTAARIATELFATHNKKSDSQEPHFDGERVTIIPEVKTALDAFCAAGFMAAAQDYEYEGMQLPYVVDRAIAAWFTAANVATSAYTFLTMGNANTLLKTATPRQVERFVRPQLAGRYFGTMCLSEPQAGSSLSDITTRAEPDPVEGPEGERQYRLRGNKMWISAGEHELAGNIVHLVLAKIPGPDGKLIPGVKGISLFIVPKFLINEDGSLGERNDAHCVSIEHKLGIKASPTAVLQFGDNGGAIGTLVGEENRGLEYMFIMMNAARFGVGMQGIGLAERAYQHAVAYAKDRVQSRDLAGSSGPVAIIHHPDVRRMLMSMRAQTEAARALAYVGAGISDVAHYHADEATRKANLAVYEYLVPIIKGWSTEMSENVARDGVQVHGGMGFIEETGAAQHYRDAKILTIYEGTTAIQANDLVGRKTVRDGGAVAKSIIAQVRETEAALAEVQGADFAAIRKQLAAGSVALEEVVDFVVANVKSDIKGVFAGSVLYLKLAGIVLGGWQMARAALVAQRKLDAGEGDAAFLRAKIATARFFADHILSQAAGMRSAIVEGSAGVLALDVEQF
ncbi:MAG TPA: acyl-CoA dehydrogenase [Massilia sp.]|nr:acyl-CoA dehydrogenase [Massilia sp.]